MKCRVCGEKLKGREGKTFCSPKCKSAFQYEQRKKEEKYFFLVDKQLKTNRKILKKHNQSGYSTIRRSTLKEEGFSEKYFTHYWKNSKGKVYFFCYDFGYQKINQNGKEKYLIVTHQHYMN